MAKTAMKNMSRKTKAPAAPAAPAVVAPVPAARPVAEKDKVRFTIYISPAMKRDLRLAQVDQDRAMNSIVVEALTQYLRGVGLEGK